MDRRLLHINKGNGHFVIQKLPPLTQIRPLMLFMKLISITMDIWIWFWRK